MQWKFDLIFLRKKQRLAPSLVDWSVKSDIFRFILVMWRLI